MWARGHLTEDCAWREELDMLRFLSSILDRSSSLKLRYGTPHPWLVLSLNTNTNCYEPWCLSYQLTGNAAIHNRFFFFLRGTIHNRFNNNRYNFGTRNMNVEEQTSIGQPAATVPANPAAYRAHVHDRPLGRPASTAPSSRFACQRLASFCLSGASCSSRHFKPHNPAFMHMAEIQIWYVGKRVCFQRSEVRALNWALWVPGAAQAWISLPMMLLLHFAWSFRGWHVTS
jgi:hypothetical protein